MALERKGIRGTPHRMNGTIPSEGLQMSSADAPNLKFFRTLLARLEQDSSLSLCSLTAMTSTSSLYVGFFNEVSTMSLLNCFGNERALEILVLMHLTLAGRRSADGAQHTGSVRYPDKPKGTRALEKKWKNVHP